MTLASEIRFKLTASQVKTNDVANPRFSPVIEKVISLANGTGADQADLLYVDAFSIAASGSATYDLNASLSDAFGTSLVGVELVGYVVIADTTNVNSILLGGSVSNQVAIFQGTNGGQTVKPGGFACNFAPNASGLAVITASTADIFALANSSSGSAVTGTVAFLFRSV